MTGLRKLIFGGLGLLTLAAGYGATLAYPSGHVSFPAFATAVVSTVAAVVIGNVGEYLATRSAPK